MKGIVLDVACGGESSGFGRHARALDYVFELVAIRGFFTMEK